MHCTGGEEHSGAEGLNHEELGPRHALLHEEGGESVPMVRTAGKMKLYGRSYPSENRPT